MDSRKGQPWNDEEKAALLRLYPDTPTKDIAQQLKRAMPAISYMAGVLGVRKSDEYMRSAHAGRINMINNSIGSRFKRGNTPHNKGVKGWDPGGNNKTTRFKPGSRPHNYLPVGSERVSACGLLARKVSETGRQRTDWVGIQALVWMEHNGPIPKGHLVVFLNGDNRDFRIENLAMLSQAENMRRNSISQYPEGLQKAIKLTNKLKRIIDEKQG